MLVAVSANGFPRLLSPRASAPSRCATGSSPPRTAPPCRPSAGRTTAWRPTTLRAKGGVGLIILENSRVHPTGRGASFALDGWPEENIPHYHMLADAVHEHGAKIFAQLHHPGRNANSLDTLFPVWAPSGIPIPWANPSGSNELPHEMTREEIAELLGWWVRCAINMQRAGMDGVEIHAAHGFPLPVPVAGDQPPQRRIRRRPGEPRAVHAGGHASGARGRRARVRSGRAPERGRAHPRRARARRSVAARAVARGLGRRGLPEHLAQRRIRCAQPLAAGGGHELAAGRLRAPCRGDQEGDPQHSGVRGLPHRRPGDGGAHTRRRQGRHGLHDERTSPIPRSAASSQQGAPPTSVPASAATRAAAGARSSSASRSAAH